MADKIANPRIKLNLSALGVPGRLNFLALLAKFAQNSTQYASNATYKAAVDKAVGHTTTLTTASNTAETAKKAASVAIGAKDTEIAATDGDIGVLRALAETILVTDADFQSNGWNRLVRGVAVFPVPPENVTAVPGKKVKGIVAHAVKIPGLFKYYCAISSDPTSTGTYNTLNGTSAKRTITGLVSGQGYWIKYCTERGSVRSAWSTPVYCVAS